MPENTQSNVKFVEVKSDVNAIFLENSNTKIILIAVCLKAHAQKEDPAVNPTCGRGKKILNAFYSTKYARLF